jgi:hypothetical protein
MTKFKFPQFSRPKKWQSPNFQAVSEYFRIISFGIPNSIRNLLLRVSVVFMACCKTNYYDCFISPFSHSFSQKCNFAVKTVCQLIYNRNDGVIVSVLVSKIGIWCFSAEYSALRRKSKDLLTWNHDRIMHPNGAFIRWVLFQWASTIKIQIYVPITLKDLWKQEN